MHEGEWQIERRVRDDIGQLVEISTKRRLLSELARHHPVDGVERHAHEHPDRNRPEPDARRADERKPDRDRNETSEDSDVIRLDAETNEHRNERTKQSLEPGLQSVDGHDWRERTTAELARMD